MTRPFERMRRLRAGVASVLLLSATGSYALNTRRMTKTCSLGMEQVNKVVSGCHEGKMVQGCQPDRILKMSGNHVGPETRHIDTANNAAYRMIRRTLITQGAIPFCYSYPYLVRKLSCNLPSIPPDLFLNQVCSCTLRLKNCLGT